MNLYKADEPKGCYSSLFFVFLFHPSYIFLFSLKVSGIMKFTAVLAVLASAVAVYARSSETNAERFARGLPPLPPARRGTPVAGELHLTIALIIYSDRHDVAARRSQPSGISNSCNTGPIQCCASTFSFFYAALLITI
jgi:hypothetical protein